MVIASVRIIHAARTRTHTLMHTWNRTAASVASLPFWSHMLLKEEVRETSQVRAVKSTRLRTHIILEMLGGINVLAIINF